MFYGWVVMLCVRARRRDDNVDAVSIMCEQVSLVQKLTKVNGTLH